MIIKMWHLKITVTWYGKVKFKKNGWVFSGVVREKKKSNKKKTDEESTERLPDLWAVRLKHLL